MKINPEWRRRIEDRYERGYYVANEDYEDVDVYNEVDVNGESEEESKERSLKRF